MPEQRNLILHVGAHKTASSLLQKGLRLHDDQLRASGLAVVHRAQMLPTDFYTTLRGLVISGEVPDEAQSDIARSSLRLLTDQPESTVLMTNEDLFEAFRRPRFYQNIGAALTWIQQLADRDLSLVLYTRSQPSYVESMYMQRVHLGDAVPFAKVRRQYGRLDLSWFRVLQDAEAVIGPDRISVYPYESIHRIGATEYYRTLLRACGLSNIGEFELSDELTTTRDANRSYSAEAMKLALAVNPLLAQKNRGALRTFLQENYSTATHARAELLGEQGRSRMADRYREQNRLLFDTYMPDWNADREPYGLVERDEPTFITSGFDKLAEHGGRAPAPGATQGSEDSEPPAPPPIRRRPSAQPTLDVLIPHFEDLPGLQRSLDSVAAQTWGGDLRAVIVDDGSRNATYDQVKSLVDAQPFPATIRRLEQNMGRPHARNVLLGEVDAPYMAWLDAGDEWYRNKLVTQFDHLRTIELEGEDLDRVWVTCHFHWAQGDTVRRVLQRTTADQLYDLMVGDKLRAYLWTLLGRTAAFRGAGLFDESLPRLQDLDYFLRFVTAGGTLTAPRSRTPLCRYYKSDIGRSHEDVDACSTLIMHKYRALYARYGRAHVARVEWNHAMLSARYAINNDSYGAAARYIAGAMATHPRYSAYKVRRKLIGS